MEKCFETFETEVIHELFTIAMEISRYPAERKKKHRSILSTNKCLDFWKQVKLRYPQVLYNIAVPIKYFFFRNVKTFDLF